MYILYFLCLYSFNLNRTVFTILNIFQGILVSYLDELESSSNGLKNNLGLQNQMIKKKKLYYILAIVINQYYYTYGKSLSGILGTSYLSHEPSSLNVWYITLNCFLHNGQDDSI